MQVFLQTTYHKYYNYACMNNQQKITRGRKRAKNKCYKTRNNAEIKKMYFIFFQYEKEMKIEN